MTKKWKFYDIDQEKANRIKNKLKISELLSEILVNRNVKTEEEARIFLNPTRNDFYDPFLFKDMDIAVDRIIKAIEEKEKVVIYGDYDVDGITSTTVLKQFLEERGLKADTYIPNRLDEGY